MWSHTAQQLAKSRAMLLENTFAPTFVVHLINRGCSSAGFVLSYGWALNQAAMESSGIAQYTATLSAQRKGIPSTVSIF